MSKSILALAGGVAIAAALFAASTASAAILYLNPASGYDVSGTPITGAPPTNYAGNTFTLASASVVKGVGFESWNGPDSEIKAIVWQIIDGPIATGNVLASGFTAVSPNFNTLNFYNVYIFDNQFTIPDLTLAAGNYWLYLGGAVTADGGLAAWDNTTSTASLYENKSGRANGNTFRILGDELVRGGGNPGGGGPCNTNLQIGCEVGLDGGVPEPSSWALMILGFGGAGAALRSRRRAAA